GRVPDPGEDRGANGTGRRRPVMSPKMRIRVATAWPYASRNTRSTAVTSGRPALTGRVTPGRGPSLGTGEPRSDAGSRPRPCGPGQRGIEAVRADDVEPGDVLLRLDEGPVGHDHVPLTRAEDGRGVGVVERPTEDERAGRLHLVLEGDHPLHQRFHVLGRLRSPGDLALHGVR